MIHLALNQSISRNICKNVESDFCTFHTDTAFAEYMEYCGHLRLRNLIRQLLIPWIQPTKKQNRNRQEVDFSKISTFSLHSIDFTNYFSREMLVKQKILCLCFLHTSCVLQTCLAKNHVNLTFMKFFRNGWITKWNGIQKTMVGSRCFMYLLNIFGFQILSYSISKSDLCLHITFSIKLHFWCVAC